MDQGQGDIRELYGDFLTRRLLLWFPELLNLKEHCRDTLLSVEPLKRILSVCRKHEAFIHIVIMI